MTLYEKTVQRNPSGLEENEKIQSAYEQVLAEAKKEGPAYEVREALKKQFGLTSRDVSVRSKRGSIDITLKTVKALPYMKKIKNISSQHERYQLDQATQTILRGGNTFVFVNLDWKFRDRLVKQIEAEISKKITDEFMHGEGGGNTITVYGNYEVVKWRNTSSDEFGVLHKKQSSAGPIQRSIMECAGRVLHLMLEFEDEKALKKLK